MTVSPLSVRQWKDAEGNPQEQKNHNSSNNSNSSHPHNSTDIRDNNDVDTGQTLNVPAAQTLLLQQVLPLYAEMAQSFSTHRTLDAKHLSILLEQLQALATSLHIHLEQAIRNKILLNGRKYPVEQAKGKMFKYTEYSQTTGITKQDGQSTIDFPNVYTGRETTSSELHQLQQEIREFAAQRDWYPFHTPRNLCLALGGELGELVEQLLLLETVQTDKLYQEVADVTIYLLRLADVCQLPLFAADASDHEDVTASVRSFPVTQSLHSAVTSSSGTVCYSVGLIRDSILQLWIHWTRHDKERWSETIQNMCTLLNYCPNATAPTATCSHSTTSWLSFLCLLGELSDQFQFLGDEEQPLHKHAVICHCIQQMVQYSDDDIHAKKAL